MKRFWRMAAVLLVSGLAVAQTTTTTTTTTAHKTKAKTHTKRKPTTAEDLEEMKVRMQAQQDQIDALKSQLADRDQKVSTADQNASTAQQAAAAAQAKADEAASSSQAATDQVTALKSTVTDIKNTNQGLQETVIANQAHINEELESPSKLHYKGITITPVAFFAFEGVWRQRSTNSDINTPFNSIPFPGANEGHVSELNFSARQSRIGGLFEGDAGNFKLSGYIEADFLSSGTTSNDNQSNSYTLRQRQFWGKAETANRFAVTGGQMWSLITETGLSTNARTEKLPNTIDPQYMVGYSWTRQPGIRFQQQFGNVKSGMFTAAMSIEQAQALNVGVSGTAPAAYFYQGAGAGGGLYNATANYSNNVAPDFLVKGTLDYTHAHFELGGLARFFRSVYNPLTSGNSSTYTYDTTQQLKNTKVGGGVFGSARVSPAKFVDVAFQFLAGDGVARYGSSTLSDVTVRTDGTLEPIRHYQGLFSLETHPTKKLDVFAYYGGEYNQRTQYQIGSNIFGYGARSANNGGCYAVASLSGVASSGGSDSATNCTGATRYIQEGMIGWTYRFVNSPKYGRFQYSMTYQLLQRALWSGVTTGSTVPNAPTGPRAQDSMIHVGMRYYIP